MYKAFLSVVLAVIVGLSSSSVLAIASQDLPVRVVVKPKLKAQSSIGSGYRTLRFSGDPEEVIKSLQETGLYSLVELDVVVSNNPPVKSQSGFKEFFFDNVPYNLISEEGFAGLTVLNDEHFAGQYSWMHYNTDFTGASREFKSGSNILKAYSAVEPNNTVDVVVLDGGFPAPGYTTDIAFAADSYDFTTLNSKRDAVYYEDDLNGCDHGYGVASILGAVANNGVGGAGMGEFSITAGKVLSCDVGYLSDSADALRWAAGGETEYYAYDEANDTWYWEVVPAREKVADVVNMSLGGESYECPDYMQEAVDFAISQGTTVVVAAGNDNLDASQFAPANCRGVITVGALELGGAKADFSNFGENVDVAALGVEVSAACAYGEGCWWSGTSFASPLVAGQLAMIKSEVPELSPAEVEYLLKQTANPFNMDLADNIDNSCAAGRCGAGVTDAFAFLEAAREFDAGSLFSIRHVLQDEECPEALFLNATGQSLRLCEMYEATLGLPDDTVSHYELYRVPVSESILSTEFGELIASSNSVKLVLGDIDSSEYRYGVKACMDDVCAAELVELNTNSISKPASCTGI
ncbi:S8 family serine peptidase [Agarivorans gilvus]|uniref:Peptidase S8/S53 domain-containing protein n=1 Tax=Agarivorans gilvus TaxID=680279 RepID=A0ABQ1I1I0_9ALTE|nr:S8 family serine peptidase [Agarivorans gilvus]GGB05347.1 hypothetical protein GCM10007414_18340 [Agarivorans gilvus]